MSRCIAVRRRRRTDRRYGAGVLRYVPASTLSRASETALENVTRHGPSHHFRCVSSKGRRENGDHAARYGTVRHALSGLVSFAPVACADSTLPRAVEPPKPLESCGDYKPRDGIAVASLRHRSRMAGAMPNELRQVIPFRTVT